MMRRLVALVGMLLFVACRTEVPKVSCSTSADCGSNDGGHDTCKNGVCVACQAKETNCFDGVDEDCDDKTDCADEDCGGLVCRPSAGPCDLAEVCPGDGTTKTCPADAYLGTDTVCRAASACGQEAKCTGTSADCPASIAINKDKVCREAAGPCAEPAKCDGVGFECPATVFKALGTVCYTPTADEPCLQESRCDGVSAACPPTPQPTSHLCRAHEHECAKDTYCDGKTALCPQAAAVEAGALCRAAAGDCDLLEACDGASLLCPPDKMRDAGAVCRPAKGVCDVLEVCDGLSPACPPDAKLGASYACYTPVVECTLPRYCDGSTDTCPAVAKVAPAGTICRPAVPGGCDVDEKCDGLSAACPPDAVAPASVICRASLGECDPAETCTGTSAACPPDSLYPATRLCRQATQPCEKDTFCSGNGTACPAAAPKPSGVQCAPADLAGCSAPKCTGQSLACDAANPSMLPQGTQCGLTAPEVCNGTVDACPPQAVIATTAGGWSWDNPRPQGHALRGIGGPAAGKTTPTWFVGDVSTMLRFDTSKVFSLVPVVTGLQHPALRAISVADTGAEAWAVGDQGTLLHYSNGGWTPSSAMNITASSLNGVWFSGTDVFIAADSGQVYHLAGAAGPVAETTITGGARAVWGSALNDVWAVGASGTVMHRAGSAGLWTSVTCVATGNRPPFTSVWGVGAGALEKVFITAADPDQPLYSWTSGSGCVQVPGATSMGPLNAVWASGENVWAAGDKGRIVHGLHGTYTVEVSQAGAPALRAVFGSSIDDVWFAGDNGSIIHRVLDGGYWHYVSSRSVTQSDLTAVTGAIRGGMPPVTGPDIFAAGKGSTLLHRTTGWTPMNFSNPTPMSANFAAIAAKPVGATSGIEVIAVGASAMAGDAGGAIALCQSPADSCSDKTSMALTYAQDWNGVGVNSAALTLAGINSSIQLLPISAGYGAPTPLIPARAMNGVYGVQGSQVTALDVWLVGSGGAFYKAGTPITNASMAADLVAISGVGDAAIPNKVSLVAVGPTTIATSVNGTPLVSWGTPAGQPRAVWVNTAANFVVVGDGGYAQFVGNGSATGNWAGTSETLNGVWGDPTFGIWAVGNKGVILTHPTP